MRTETATPTQSRNSRVDVILDLIDQALAEYDEANATPERTPLLTAA